jgi:hypothetical protein
VLPSYTLLAALVTASARGVTVSVAPLPTKLMV